MWPDGLPVLNRVVASYFGNTEAMGAGNRKRPKALARPSVKSYGGFIESMAPATLAGFKSLYPVLKESANSGSDAAI
jgi:hypothetical protein